MAVGGYSSGSWNDGGAGKFMVSFWSVVPRVGRLVPAGDRRGESSTRNPSRQTSAKTQTRKRPGGGGGYWRVIRYPVNSYLVKATGSPLQNAWEEDYLMHPKLSAFPLSFTGPFYGSWTAALWRHHRKSLAGHTLPSLGLLDPEQQGHVQSGCLRTVPA